MRFSLVLFLLATVSISLSAQTKNINGKENKDTIVMPQYPGGHEEMIEFLFAETNYPDEAYEKKEKGEVLVFFFSRKINYNGLRCNYNNITIGGYMTN